MESGSIQSRLDQVPRGTLLVSVGILWAVLFGLFSFLMGDVWGRLRENENKTQSIQLDVRQVQTEHVAFEAWLQRMEAKMDAVLFEHYGMTFGERGPDTIRSTIKQYEASPIEIH